MKRASSSFSLWSVSLIAVLMAVGVTGCRSGGGSNDASVRLINAAPEAQDLSVSVDGQRVWKHAAFGSNTGFQGVGAGTYRVNIDAQVDGNRLTGRNYLMTQKGKAYTVVAISQEPSADEPPGLRIFSEDRNAPVPPGKVRLRVINAGDGLGPVDVLFNNIVGFGEVPFGARTQALLLDPGVYALKVNAADQVPSLTGPVSLHFLPGHAYTLVVMGKRGSDVNSQSISIAAYPDNR